MALLHGHRRSSRTPLLAIASLAGAVLIFRFSFASRPSSVQSAVGILDSKEGYSDYFSSHARSLAEQLILKKKENDGDRGSNSASSNKKVDPNQGIDLGDWTQPLRDDFATYENEDLAPSGLSLAELEEKMILSEGPVRLCPECKCDKAGSYAESSSFTVPIPTLEKLRSLVKTSRSFNDRSLLRYLLHHIQLQSTLDGLYVPDEAISWLLTNHFTCPDNLIAFNFDGLKLDKPTSYIYTRTGPGGKLAKWEDRGRYMKRHVGVIKDYQDLVSAKGFWDGVEGDDRQLLWLVVEDEANLEPQMEVLLRDSGIPFLYFAHGPTRHFGKAQWNIVMRAIEVLRDGFFGDGPVLNLDDDCRIVPELLSKIWKVKKAVVWQVGNYPCKSFNSWWEGPIFENGTIKTWQYAWMPDRVFPIDLNGFAINSSVIGPDRPIAPPQYIPFDLKAGETEFLEKIYSSRDEIEPLCENTKAEDCYYTWHNSWIRPSWHDHGPD